MGRIITHRNPDLDAAASAWAAGKFITGLAKAEIVFVSADWDGAGLEEGDLAVDIYAGGNGLKGDVEASGVTHSCFRWILEHFAPREDRTALQHITAFIDAEDSTGNPIKVLAPNTSADEQKQLHAVSFGAMFSAVKNINRGNDAAVVEWMSKVLDYFLETGRNQPRSIEQAHRIPVVGGVAITRNMWKQVQDALFEECGARAIVYVNGNNVGVNRHKEETTRMDHPAIRAVAEATGEKWFAHPAGFLFCRGSYKAPAETPSKVRPEDLAKAVAKALADKSA